MKFTNKELRKMKYNGEKYIAHFEDNLENFCYSFGKTEASAKKECKKKHQIGSEHWIDVDVVELVETPFSSPIQVWRYDDAPRELKEMSKFGGDEDWVALVPPHSANEWLGWAEEGTPFGCCGVQRVELDDGRVVLIGAHA